MGLFKRKNSPYYFMKFQLNGQRIYESTKTANKKLAEDIYLDKRHEIMTGMGPEREKEIDKSYTFYQMIDKYLEWAEPRQKGAKIKRYVFNRIKTFIPDMPLTQIDNNVLEKLQTAFLKKEFSIAYTNKAYNTIKAMLTKAENWDLIDEDGLRKARKCKILKGENKRLRYLADEEEAERLISNCEPHLRPLVVTALYTGMRKSEIFGLTWDRVDLKNRVILLDKTKNWERREVPIIDTLYNTLSGLTRHLKCDYVFYNPRTLKPFDRLKESWARALKKSHILNFHFHDLRHTFASWLVMAGVDLTTVKVLLGHKDIKMTLRYAHLAPAHIRKAVEILDKRCKIVAVEHGKEIENL